MCIRDRYIGSRTWSSRGCAEDTIVFFNKVTEKIKEIGLKLS